MAPASRGRQLGDSGLQGVCLPRGAGCRCPGLSRPPVAPPHYPLLSHPASPPATWAPLLARPVLALSSCLAGLDLNLQACCETFLVLRPAAALTFPHIQPSVCLAPGGGAREGRPDVCWHMWCNLANVFVCATWDHSRWVSSPPRQRVWCGVLEPSWAGLRPQAPVTT